MAHPTSVFFVLFAIPSSFFLHSLSPADAASPLVEGVCRESTSYAFCIQALQSDPKTPSAKDYMSLATIALNLGVSNATDTKSYITTMHDDRKTDPGKKAALKLCMDSYDGAVASFKSALAELQDDVLSANYDVKIAGDDVKNCEQQLASGGVKDSAISERNQFSINLSNIGDVITGHLL